MKGDLTLKILETIENLAVSAVDIFDTLLSAGYGASFSKLEYEFLKRQRKHEEKSIKKERGIEAKQKYYNLIYKLKKNDLIEEKIKEGKKFFIITKKGKEKLAFLKKQNKKALPKISYSKQKSNKFVIVIFDIPEEKRAKRDWLRASLRVLGFKMIQKSVWIGKIKLPKQFIDDLFNLNLIDFVEIFEISKTGSLKHLA